jgi:guanylate kinase
VGKGTIVAALRRIVPEVWVSVSCTTRSPRPGETEGIEYHFVDRVEFARMVDTGELLEHAEFAGNCYGTPRRPVLEHIARGIPTLLEIELQGARQVRATMPEAHFVFLAPPSVEELVDRLEGRGTETDAELAARMELAKVEIAAEAEFDVVVVNDDVERAAREIAALLV